MMCKYTFKITHSVHLYINHYFLWLQIYFNCNIVIYLGFFNKGIYFLNHPYHSSHQSLLIKFLKIKLIFYMVESGNTLPILTVLFAGFGADFYLEPETTNKIYQGFPPKK